LLIVGVASTVFIAGCGGSGGRTTTAASTESESAIKPMSSMTGSGKAVFEAQCSSCHKLIAANATFATYGPDLDQLKPSEGVVETQVRNGGGIMPAYGKHGILTASEIKAVAAYVSSEAGK